MPHNETRETERHPSALCTQLLLHHDDVIAAGLSSTLKSTKTVQRRKTKGTWVQSDQQSVCLPCQPTGRSAFGRAAGGRLGQTGGMGQPHRSSHTHHHAHF